MKSLIRSLFILTLFAPYISKAQWQEVPVEVGLPFYTQWLDSDEVYIEAMYAPTTVSFILNGENGIIWEQPNPLADVFVVRDTFLSEWTAQIRMADGKGKIIKTFYDIDATDTGSRAVTSHLIQAFGRNNWAVSIVRLDDSMQTYYTKDGGDSWQLGQTLYTSWPFWVHAAEPEVQIIDSCVWMYTHYMSDILFRSTDYGYTWEKIKLPPCAIPSAYRPFAFADANFGLMVCHSDAGLLKTNDGGRTWTSDGLKRPNRYNQKITYAKPSGNKEGLFFIYGKQGGCHVSSSKGQWWHKLDDLKHEWLTFYDAEHGMSFFLDSASGEYRFRMFQNNVQTGLKPEHNEAISVYPNPVSDYLKTKLQEEVSIDVYDITGKMVLSSPGFNAANPLYIGDLKPGTYCLRIGSLGWAGVLIKK